MDIEKIASKLKPLMPEKISKWIKARELSGPDMRTLIEKQIISVAYKTFGDFNSKILLSLPPENKAQGAVNLGTILYDKEKYPLGISTTEFTQNMAILGRSGSGKTNVTFHILRQLVDRNIPFVFMDWKRTVRHLIPNFGNKLEIYTPGRDIVKLPFNPFVVPPGVEPNVYIGQLVDIMSHAFTLGDGSRSIIRKALLYLSGNGNTCPTVGDVIAELEKVPCKGRAGGWKLTAMRALESLEFAGISSKDKISQEDLAQKMLESFTVIELDALSGEAKKFIIPIMCLWLYYVRLGSTEREKLKLVIFIEEAHHVLHKQAQCTNETILEMLLRQCRELGIGIVVIDQHPHLLSSAALGNTFTTIFLNQKDPADINKAAAVCSLDTDEKRYFSMLPVGQGIVKLQDRWTSPIHLQFPLVKVDKGSVTDRMLARYFSEKRAKTSRSGRNTCLKRFSGDVRDVRLFDIALDTPAFHFLQDIMSHPGDCIRIRYKRLNLTADKGNKLKQLLTDQNWIQSESINTGKTRRLLLKLTPYAQTFLGIKDAFPDNASITHEYWKRFYAQRFAELGYRVSLEVPRISGRVDLVAVKDNHKIAVEIETGKSDFLRNIRQNLLAKYGKIIVIATDKNALEKIEHSLAKEGLIIVGRIEVYKAGQFKPSM